ncbi:MAG: transposase [Deltaproteobacteria bacterium]|nr:transposase [Deltaproteobacteria bacterium]
MARAEQQELRFPNTWGGRRLGAGRPKGAGRCSALHPHTARPAVSRHRPIHVTVRSCRGTWNLRSQRCLTPVARALRLVRDRADFRVVHFSVQHDHLHLIVEADHRRALSNGLRALLSRAARGLNRVMQARGRRFADRHHEHALATPTEVRNALRYVLGNRASHRARRGLPVDHAGVDPFSSLAVPVVAAPGSWLLRLGSTGVAPPREHLE